MAEWIAGYCIVGVGLVVARMVLELRATGWRLSSRSRSWVTLMVLAATVLLWLPLLLWYGIKETFFNV